MQEFYKKALLAFIVIVLADALFAVVFIERSYLSLPILPGQKGTDGRAVEWHRGYTVTPWRDGPPVIRVDGTMRDGLRFDLNLPPGTPDLNVSADLIAADAKGTPGLVDLSQYGTVSFLAKCAPANSMVFIISIHDERVSEPGNFLTYPPALTYFSCNEEGVPVSIDTTRLSVPQWWFDTFHRDVSRRDFKLDRVGRFVFGVTSQSPRGVPSHVEISKFEMRGRDYRWLAWLAALVAAGWAGFGIWFFRAQSRAMIASVDTTLKTDLPLVAYRQLTLEPYRDKEKVSVLRFIASNYTNPELDLEGVVAGTGTNRTKVNDVLKSELGMTFTSYLNKLRLTEAARLLVENSGTGIAEIAFSVGYANVSYFNKLFKEEYGCTPKAFRALAVQQEQPDGPVQEAAAP
ncbi:helix-turn-helix domain-containing protein [Massilia pinisoli]|uniref:Helix-turn-helix domain-containing protein n=1 Tax=Massilia pinisoli TaxID=1772194 RepID=A0ABT1ZWP4_9BURK|nr:helix-turn-helix domain-containing protein [Massilia pinisoli]MCS0584029.1 helix-turn-helix domain-containing protein [Massilia pinisoli]